MKVNGTEVFWSPYKSPAELKAKPQMLGNPFLAPWANRIEGMSYWVNGGQYTLNPNLGNLRLDGNKNPIHGLVTFSDAWKVVESGSVNGGLVSRLEMFRNPKILAQFPFPHTLTMTYRLADGALEVITEIENLGTEAMPVAIGYHPYYQLPDGRDAWTVRIPALEHVELSSTLIPNGRREKLSAPIGLPLQGNKQDDVYTSLIRNASGNAEFWVTNGKQKLSFFFGPKYQVGVVYAPPGRDFVCFEPMAAITDAFNQNHKGQYSELQTIPPGKTWREVWSIKPSGF
jgi:aldose 1-epimerase